MCTIGVSVITRPAELVHEKGLATQIFSLLSRLGALLGSSLITKRNRSVRRSKQVAHDCLPNDSESGGTVAQHVRCSGVATSVQIAVLFWEASFLFASPGCGLMADDRSELKVCQQGQGPPMHPCYPTETKLHIGRARRRTAVECVEKANGGRFREAEDAAEVTPPSLGHWHVWNQRSDLVIEG